MSIQAKGDSATATHTMSIQVKWDSATATHTMSLQAKWDNATATHTMSIQAKWDSATDPHNVSPGKMRQWYRPTQCLSRQNETVLQRPTQCLSRQNETVLQRPTQCLPRQNETVVQTHTMSIQAKWDSGTDPHNVYPGKMRQWYTLTYLYKCHLSWGRFIGRSNLPDSMTGWTNMAPLVMSCWVREWQSTSSHPRAQIPHGKKIMKSTHGSVTLKQCYM